MTTLLENCCCGSSSGRETYYNNIPVIVCSNCNIIRQNVDMTEEEYSKYYIDNYFNTDYTRSYNDEVNAARKRIVVYGKFLTGRILDIGCGLGGFVSHLRENNFDCWGQDIASISDEKTTYYGELDSINFPTDYFQTVTLHDVLEHIINPVDFLKEIFRLVSQEGYLIVDFPNFYAEAGQKHWKKTQHLWMLEYKHLFRMIKNIGFTIVKTTEPIPGKIVVYAQKPKQKRVSILVPPGIGDIYWVLVKLESFLEKNNISIPDIYIQEQGDRNRGESFVQKFPFLNAAGYAAPIGGLPEYNEAYKQDKRTIFKDVGGCDYFIAFNGPMRFDRSLENIHPEYKINWYLSMFIDKEEDNYGREALNKYGDYIVGYFSGHKMYQRWLSEFSYNQIAESIININKQTGYKFILVGSHWDLDGPGEAITKLAPDVCINIVDQTSLTQLFGLFKYSKGVIGFPSGITIMSVALKINTIMIWNNYFRESFWKNACVTEAWNKWYRAFNSKNLQPKTIVDSYMDMLRNNA